MRIRTADLKSLANQHVVYSATELPFTREGVEPSTPQIFLNLPVRELLRIVKYLWYTIQHAAGTAWQEVTSNTRAYVKYPAES